MAHSRALAHDTVDAIAVEYAAFPAVVNAEKALDPGAPRAREEPDSNIMTVRTLRMLDHLNAVGHMLGRLSPFPGSA